MYLKYQEHLGIRWDNLKQKNAVLFYDRMNHPMRSLKGMGTYRSDCDNATCLLYIVREDPLLDLTIVCFNIEDNGKWIK